MTSLSGGERQRVHLARALCQLGDAGRVLLLDEPTSALDLRAQQRALATLGDLARSRRVAVVCVLHDLNVAAAWADRITLLRSGEVVADGAPAEVVTAPILELALGVRAHVLAHPVHGRPQVLV